jgi:hypothetical protein
MATETQVRERPILFSGPMVRAILDGRKTQTRRVVKPQPGPTATMLFDGVKWYANGLIADCKDVRAYCPYGEVGDRLWVREAFMDFCPIWAGYWCGCGTKEMQHDTHLVAYKATKTGIDWKEHKNVLPLKWKPSIHMARAWSRITLEITDVRVERLQIISAKDIIAEGVVERAHHNEHFGKMPVSAFDGAAYVDLISLWAAGWDSVNGKKHPFSSNPWCWVISFKRVSP